ncbi:hypothetical protein DPMN_133528 [Dreissena polymorpha]|uniref:Uncharacterized protein n=1 Tax=Dreissena polymorpha TaxID=45954 RepID=A0A9D4FVQ5_DREPO|nr:hypothetical protein DPMN_133528 [Dreissena polymorpha]
MKRGRPRNTWRHGLDADAKKMGQTWEQLERLAQTTGGSWLAAYVPDGTKGKDEMR